MKNNLILETNRIKEIMGISSSKDIISEQKWLTRLITKFGTEGKLVQRFFNEGPAFRNFDELRGFLKSSNGARFLTKMDDIVTDLRSKGKNTKADMVEGLKNQLLAEKAKPIFTKEWQLLKSDIKIQNLFTKNPNAEQSIKNWLETQVAAGQSVNSIGIDKIKNMIKKIDGASKSRFEVIEFANKYISSGGAKIALAVVIGGAALGFWSLVDVLKWLKGVVYTPEPTPDKEEENQNNNVRPDNDYNPIPNNDDNPEDVNPDDEPLETW